jgi:hypothetical protein
MIIMKITLKDGSFKEYEGSMSVLDITKDISEGLARVATSARVNGEVVDLRHVVDEDCELEILTFDNEEGKGAFWHTHPILWHRQSNVCIRIQSLRSDRRSRMDSTMM